LGWNQPQAAQLLPIVQNHKWGFISATGQVVIEPTFDAIERDFRFSDDRLPFGDRQTGKWGFIDSRDDVIVKPKFDNAYPFWGGRAMVKIGKQFVYIKPDGTELKGRFEQATSFQEGRAFVRGSDWHWRMIDLEGNLVTEDKFSFVGDFSQGLAPFSGRNNEQGSGFIDRTGQVKIDIHNAHPDFEGYGFMNGLTPIFVRSPYALSQFFKPDTWGNEVWGVIDRTGRQIVPFKYENISEFSDCLAAVEVDGKYGVIDTQGRMVIQPQFDFIGRFSEGLAAVVNHKYGFINKTGQIVVQPQFNFGFYFHEGLAPVQGDNGKFGYIDPTGKVVIDMQFDAIAPFIQGLAQVDAGDKWGYIDHTGNFIWSSTEH
jgi:hypothetical protein